MLGRQISWQNYLKKHQFLFFKHSTPLVTTSLRCGRCEDACSSTWAVRQPLFMFTDKDIGGASWTLLVLLTANDLRSHSRVYGLGRTLWSLWLTPHTSPDLHLGSFPGLPPTPQTRHFNLATSWHFRSMLCPWYGSRTVPIDSEKKHSINKE